MKLKQILCRMLGHSNDCKVTGHRNLDNAEISHCKRCKTPIVKEPSCSELREEIRNLESSLIRIAEAHGVNSPLVLIAMAENDEETYADLLAKYIEREFKQESKS